MKPKSERRAPLIERKGKLSSWRSRRRCTCGLLACQSIAESSSRPPVSSLSPRHVRASSPRCAASTLPRPTTQREFSFGLGCIRFDHVQLLVSLTLARGEVPVMVALRLFLPDSWVNNRRRLKRAGVPAEYRTSRTKPEIALAEIDRLISIGVRFRCVLADAGCGCSCAFPSRADSPQACLGGWHPSSPQGVPCWGPAHLASYQSSRPAT